jgi:hypothetical protein
MKSHDWTIGDTTEFPGRFENQQCKRCKLSKKWLGRVLNSKFTIPDTLEQAKLMRDDCDFVLVQRIQED